jgi:hypothetical protein
MIKTYRDLHRLETFEERYEYLRLGGFVGADTFGFDRYLNQEFYKSVLWRRARDYVIARDYGCDLGIEGREIYDRVYVHHMNPMTPKDIKHSNLDIVDPEFLICVTHNTHNAIHYGDADRLAKGPIERRPGDTKLW